MDNNLRQNPTVLIIEDSPLDGEILMNLIESNGGIAFVVDSYEKALAVIDTMQFEAATVDLNLADDLSGSELIRRLQIARPNSKFKNRIVVITGTEMDQVHVSRLKSEGILDVMTKPVDAHRLLALLSMNPVTSEA